MAQPSTSPDQEEATTTDQLLSVRGRRLRVVVRTPPRPAGPPLLLLNGIGATLDLLDPFVVIYCWLALLVSGIRRLWSSRGRARA